MPAEQSKTTLFVHGLSTQANDSDLETHFGGIGPLRHVVIVTASGTKESKGFGFVTYSLSADADTALKALNGSVLHGRKMGVKMAKPRMRKGEEKEKRVRDVEKNVGSAKGSLAMRTVILSKLDDSVITEEEGVKAVDGKNEKSGFEQCVISGNSLRVRCTFATWALAGKAAARAHGGGISAVVEALRGGRKTRLIVRNLPFLVDELELRERFVAVAPVREVQLAPSNKLKIGKKEDGKDGKTACGGYAFVEYFLVADAKYAITKVNEAKIGGRVVAVDMAIDKGKYQSSQVEEKAEEEVEEKVEEEVEEEVSKDAEMEEEEEEEEEEIEEEVEKKKEGKSSSDEMKRTVFVRNLLFETNSAELWTAMEAFGTVEQAVIVVDRVTKRPRGTAFVRFESEAMAEEAVKQGGDDKSGAVSRNAEDGFCLQGRRLLITMAVDRSKAKELIEDGQKDKRNLRLAWIGVIEAGSKAAKGLPKEEVERRSRDARMKRMKLEKNPNSFVSDVRLSVRNLPKELDERALKELFLLSANDGADRKDVAKISHIAIVRDKERNDRSKGFGFVEFSAHSHALRALNKVNNNAKALEYLLTHAKRRLKLDEEAQRKLRKMWGVRRLSVEFAVEDRRKVDIINRIKEKGRLLALQHRKDREESGEGVKGKVRKSDRKAAMKRSRGRVQRAIEKEREGEKVVKRERAEVKKVRKVKKVDERDGGNVNEVVVKKVKKKKRKIETQDDGKFDQLVQMYTRKLRKTEKGAVAGEGNAEGAGAEKKTGRWFA